MRYKIQRLGRTKLVLIITALSLALAIIFDVFLARLLDHEISWSEDILRASIIPLLIAPFISWYLIGLLLELHHLEKETNRLATYDSLTKLFNRRAFLQACEVIHNLANRNKQQYCFFVIDVDYFKDINDTYGHPCGDLVLAALGKLLIDASRKSDVIGRLGGEEFGFVLPNTNKQQAAEYAQRLHDEINALQIEYESKIIKVSVSIGISVNVFNENFSLEEIYSQADKALYNAKDNGRNQFAFYS